MNDKSSDTAIAAVKVEFERKLITAPATCMKCSTRYVSPTTETVWNECHCGGELRTGMHKALTPDASLPPMGDGPRRKMLIEIEVSADFEKRLDNQWMVEREIAADRWSWKWKPESGSIEDPLVLSAVQRVRAADTGEWIKPGSDKSAFINALDSLYKAALK